MGKTVREFIDIMLLIVFLAIGASFTMSAINNLKGMRANLATDKVTLEGAAYYSSITYTVGDIILATSRFDQAMPLDILILKVNGDMYKQYDCKTSDVIADKFLVARDISRTKPANADFATFYTYPVDMSLATSSLTGVTCTLNIITLRGGVS